MPRHLLRCLFFLSLLTAALPHPAIGATEQDSQTWLNVVAVGKTHSEDKLWSRFRYWLEAQQRLGDDSSRPSQSLTRTALGFAATENTTLWIGHGWVRTSEPFTPIPNIENQAWEQFLWIKNLPRLVFTSRTRTEQRFLERAPKTAYRFRQLFRITVPLPTINNNLTFGLSDEIFLHKNDFIGENGRGFNQNRFFTGFGYNFGPEATVEIGYLNQYTKRFGVPNFFLQALSLNLFLRL